MTRIRTAAAIDPTDRFAQQLRSLQEQVAELQRGRPVNAVDYTPTLTSMSVGTTGGSNTATYAYSGGLLIVQGRLVWGTAGTRTFPTSASRIGLPSGFTAEDIGTTSHDVGSCTMAGVNSHGRVWLVSTTALRPIAPTVNGADVRATSPTATVPTTWADGTSMTWHAFVIGSFS